MNQVYFQYHEPFNILIKKEIEPKEGNLCYLTVILGRKTIVLAKRKGSNVAIFEIHF